MDTFILNFKDGKVLTKEEYYITTEDGNIASYTGEFEDTETLYSKGKLCVEADLYSDETGRAYDTRIKIPYKKDSTTLSISVDTKSIKPYFDYCNYVDLLVRNKIHNKADNVLTLKLFKSPVDNPEDTYEVDLNMLGIDYTLYIDNSHKLAVDNLMAIEEDNATNDISLIYQFFKNGYRLFEYENEESVADVTDNNGEYIVRSIQLEKCPRVGNSALANLRFLSTKAVSMSMEIGEVTEQEIKAYPTITYYNEKYDTEIYVERLIYDVDRPICSSDAHIYGIYQIEDQGRFKKVNRTIVDMTKVDTIFDTYMELAEYKSNTNDADIKYPFDIILPE